MYSNIYPEYIRIKYFTHCVQRKGDSKSVQLWATKNAGVDLSNTVWLITIAKKKNQFIFWTQQYLCLFVLINPKLEFIHYLRATDTWFQFLVISMVFVFFWFPTVTTRLKRQSNLTWPLLCRDWNREIFYIFNLALLRIAFRQKWLIAAYG